MAELASAIAAGTQFISVTGWTGDPPEGQLIRIDDELLGLYIVWYRQARRHDHRPTPRQALRQQAMTEPDEVQLGNCCPDDDMGAGETTDSTELLREWAERETTKVPVRWIGQMTVRKYRGPLEPGAQPYEVIQGPPNLLLNDGADFILNRIIGTSGTSFSNANARICVGNGTTTPAVGDTDLSGSSKHREAMDATYPSVTSHVLTFFATFETGDANFAWTEWGVANDATAGVLLNRSLGNFGTKTSSDTWTAEVTCTLSGG